MGSKGLWDYGFRGNLCEVGESGMGFMEKLDFEVLY